MDTRMPRFDRLERVVHWSNATLFLVLLGTGASLYVGPISTIVAHRHTVKTIHVYAGLLLPVPLVLGILLPYGRRLRADIARFNRWSADDRKWWSRRTSAKRPRFWPLPRSVTGSLYTSRSSPEMVTSEHLKANFCVSRLSCCSSAPPMPNAILSAAQPARVAAGAH